MALVIVIDFSPSSSSAGCPRVVNDMVRNMLSPMVWEWEELLLVLALTLLKAEAHLSSSHSSGQNNSQLLWLCHYKLWVVKDFMALRHHNTHFLEDAQFCRKNLIWATNRTRRKSSGLWPFLFLLPRQLLKSSLDNNTLNRNPFQPPLFRKNHSPKSGLLVLTEEMFPSRSAHKSFWLD